MTKISLIATLFFSAPLFSQSKISLTTIPEKPVIFAPGEISTGMSERDLALSPDGNEIFYTIQLPQGLFQTIVYRKKNKNGQWSKPMIAPFCGKYSDLEPAFSSDGQQLFFTSNRPLTGSTVKDFDIWVVDKTSSSTWGEPRNIGDPVNSSGDEFYPSVTKSGNLYFTASYNTGLGKEDIFIAKWNNGAYSTPVALDSNVNSKTYEFNAYVSPDESFILFTSYGRKDDKGRGDLYISQKGKNEQWTPAINLAFLNSGKLDYCPYVSPDGKILFFTSERISISSSHPDKPILFEHVKKMMDSPQNGGGDIYWVRMESVLNFVDK